MNKTIILFLANLIPIFSIAFCLFFIIPMLKNQKNKTNNKNLKELDSNTIISESNIIYGMSSFVFLFIFMLVGIIIFYLGIILNNILVSIIFGGLFIFIPLLILINVYIRYYNVSKNKYVIIEDILEDMEMIVNHSSSDSVDTRDYYYLYFKNYFSKYNKRVRVKQKVYNNAKKGDAFYLVFINNIVYAFNKKDYILSDTNRTLDIKLLKNHYNIKDFKLDENHNIYKINKKMIINDFFDNSQKKTIIFCLLIDLFLIGVGVMLCFNFIKFNWLALVLILIAFIFFLFLTIIKIKYLSGVIRNIKKDNFCIKTDKVVSINNGVPFRDSNEIISFKFNNYKKIVYADKKDFNNIKIDDEVYLVFVKNEKEPIKLYNTENSVLDNDLKEIKNDK